jgi:transposase InsO family protein
MENIYFDPKHPASFGGVRKLQKALPKEKRRDAAQWLKGERTYTLHKQARKKFITRKTRTSHHLSQWQVDLNDMISHKDGPYRYILTVIDVFSRYAWARALKTKKGVEIVQAFTEIFKQAGSPHYIQSDQGKEFENQTFLSFLKEHHVKQFSVKSPYKSGMVERFNRTLKTRMFRYFTHVGNYKWVNVLPDLVDSYNLGEHRSLPKGMSPKQASDPRRHSEVFRHQEQGGKSIAKQNTSIKIGDVVRVSKYKGVFEKGYVANFSEEVFTVRAIDQRYQPITYTIMDEKQEIIEGKFYAHELQVVKPNEWHAIEKVIRHQGKKTLVKFLGYPDEYWVNNVKDINK